MWKVSDLAGSIFIISSLTLYCVAQETNNIESAETPLKMNLIEDIVQKVCNLSLDAFSNKNPIEKAKLMIKIEEKLNKSAQALGDHGVKYVKLIMKGVRSKAFENQLTDNKDLDINSPVLRAGIAKSEPTKQAAMKSKEELINNIASKLEFLVKIHLKDAKTEKERKEAIENIKNKVIESVDRKNLTLQSKDEEIKSYVDLVGKGIEIMMRKNTEPSKRREMEFAYANNIHFRDSRDQYSKSIDPIKPDALNHDELDHSAINFGIIPKSVLFKPNKNNDFKSPFKTIRPIEEFPCGEAIEEICQKVKLVRTFHCLSDNREIHILNLCDGVGDCLDFSDEIQCAKQAIESIQSANRLMTHIDTSLSHNCYPDLMDKSMISKQNRILSDVLQNQLNFLHRHSMEGSSTYSKRVFTTDDDAIKKTVNNAVNVVDALSLALDSSICSKSDKNNSRKQGDDRFVRSKQLLEEIIETSSWAPETCKCNSQNCINVCSSHCEKTCWETYSLSQLQCDAVTGEKLVSLDTICDGKLDCYDESDEKDCTRDISLAKFEATQMYNYILKVIATKAASVDFEPLRNRQLNLHALVTKLQKLSLNRNADILEVKRVRESTFSELSMIYDTSLRYVTSPEDSIKSYSDLMTLNERLVSALKRSNTGNDKIISSDGCICRGYRCALPRCSKSCIRACSAEPKFTRYFCGGSSELNNSVPLELICNGKNNCPKGDDEKDCNKDVCRAHHLMVLRHSIRDVGEIQKGTALGEALRSWRLKVTSTLKIAESNDRPTPVVLRDIVHDILHDLVMTYSTLEDNRRSDASSIFQEFYLWSRIVMDTLKSCGQ